LVDNPRERRRRFPRGKSEKQRGREIEKIEIEIETTGTTAVVPDGEALEDGATGTGVHESGAPVAAVMRARNGNGSRVATRVEEAITRDDSSPRPAQPFGSSLGGSFCSRHCC